MIIVGLDGTLRNNSWRLPFIESEGWHTYHAQGDRDPEHASMCELIRSLSTESIFCLTATPEAWRGITNGWLVRHRIAVTDLVMRQADNWAPEGELKILMVSNLMRDHGNVIMAIDDNEKVCDAYRSMGLPVMQFYPPHGEPNV